MTKLHLKRFAELEAEADEVEKTAHYSQSQMFGHRRYVNGEALTSWKLKVRNLLVNACGRDSEHYPTFVAGEKPHTGESNEGIFKRLRSIFNAARDDYEGGYLIKIQTLVQAEVFNTELEMATEFLHKSHKVPAAVIAGTVLETALRELCDRQKIAHGKLDKMNADLAKAGAYTLLVQKRITGLAQIRNDAAHGKPDQFNDADARSMIAEVERFLADYLI
jgi:hypothetical protein